MDTISTKKMKKIQIRKYRFIRCVKGSTNVKERMEEGLKNGGKKKMN